jgi:hypothetical protein
MSEGWAVPEDLSFMDDDDEPKKPPIYALCDKHYMSIIVLINLFVSPSG